MSICTKDKLVALLGAAVIAPFVVLHASHYYPFISDDALISLRYVERLLQGQGLTWTDGRPVEGYSNLLWMLAVALLGVFRIDLIDATRILGVLATIIVAVAICYRYIGGNGVSRGWLPAAVSSVFFCLAAPIAVWSIGGLEQPLLAALIAISIPLGYSVTESAEPSLVARLSLSLVLGLACLTRPDGPIFAAAAAASVLATGWLDRRRGTMRRAALTLLFPMVFYTAQLAFRMSYYGELVPNTALVKLAPSSAHASAGWRYLTSGLTTLAPLSLAAVALLLGLLVTVRTRARGVWLLSMAAGWAAYVVAIGGDLFPAYRHLVPLIVVLAFALAEGFALAMDVLVSRPVYLSGLVVLTAASFIPYAQRQFSDKQSRRAVTERWEWQGKEVALLLKTAFSEQRPLLAVTAAGCLPYWSGLPSLDMLGLNDYYLPRHPPKDFGQGWVGHELGDGQYVMSREPDLIVFSVGSEPAFRSGDELNAMAAFHDRYVPVTVQTREHSYEARVYVDRYSRKIGIRRSADSIRVPGYLFRGEDAIARLNDADRLVVRVPGERSVSLAIASDPAQSWVADLRSADASGITAELRQDGGTLFVTLRSKSRLAVDVEEVVLRQGARSH